MKIDVHTHAFHPKVANKVTAHLHSSYGVQCVGKGVVDDLLPRIRNAGLSKAVVHTAALDPSQVVPANNWAIHLQNTYPELIAFGSMHVGFDKIEAELERLENCGIMGLKFHHDFQGFRMDDPLFHRLMEIMADRFILMLHVGGIRPPHENPSCPEKVAKLQTLFPESTIIAAHMGSFRYWEMACECLAGSDVLVDTSSTLPYLSKEQFFTFYNRHAPERVLFGSDYPISDPQEDILLLKEKMGFDGARVEALLNNASRLFS